MLSEKVNKIIDIKPQNGILFEDVESLVVMGFIFVMIEYLEKLN